MALHIRFVSVLSTLLLATSPSSARNDVVMLPITTVVSTPEAQQRLGDSIKFYFGTQAAPHVAQSFGSYTAHGKASESGKTEIASCEQAALSTLVQMREHATSLGANGVVGIVSDYHRHEVSSPTDIECHLGSHSAGVVLRGDVVRFAGR